MTTLLLSNVGSAIGSQFLGGTLGTLGGILGAQLGTFVGSKIDSAVFGLNKQRTTEGARLEDLLVQTSTYGKTIPIVYGTVRIAGNIIWAQRIKEVENRTVNTRFSQTGKSGPRNTFTQLTYNYFGTFAIGICEGEIDNVLRIWANDKLLNIGDFTFRLYKGTETQESDTIINLFENGNAPAYRGIAYIVFEDFPLANFGNRIPNFNFEVRRKPKSPGYDNAIEDRINGINIIPGSGEFVYDTKIQNKMSIVPSGSKDVQSGQSTRINQNTHIDEADALVSISQLQQDLPNLGWASVVVTWFADSLDIGSCKIYPAVEFGTTATTTPDKWQVANFNRDNARLISSDNEGRPRYGGTINDASLLRYLQELKKRGYKVMLYPLLQLDIEGKPWRGRMTGTPEQIGDFFDNQYNAFVTHYAQIAKDTIDAFVIGSELKGITSVKNTNDSFPAVDKLIQLSNQVRTIVGTDTKITYAADWSEYHSVNGFFNMDKLWAHNNIDVVGIDAYFPLTDRIQPLKGFTKQEIIDSWTSGEGFEYYYSDSEAKTGKTNFNNPLYAWKNIEYWWNNQHKNPDQSVTEWRPAMKKIWFTEYGFPSVDGCSNQPNVFIDSTSTESRYPHYSRRNVDFQAQKVSIDGTLAKWENSTMVTNLFLWTWDARPFPYFPDLTNVWSDGPAWITGHWIQGKIYSPTLGSVTQDILKRIGISGDKTDTTRMSDLLHGYVINRTTSVRSILETLRTAFFFDIIDSEEKLKFLPRGFNKPISVNSDSIVRHNNTLFKITRIQDIELPKSTSVVYINRLSNYQLGTQRASRNQVNSNNNITINLPIVFDNNQARRIADVTLYNAWQKRLLYNFTLSNEYIDLEPGDIIDVDLEEIEHTVLITKVTQGNLIEIEGVSEDISIYSTVSRTDTDETQQQTNIAPSFASRSYIKVLDIPPLPDYNIENNVYVAVTGLEKGWNGATIYASRDNGENYEFISHVTSNATQGKSINRLMPGPISVIDNKNSVDVILIENSLQNISKNTLLNNGNLALLGKEIIQFQNAELIGSNRYRLSGLLRGQLNTEDTIASHKEVEDFVLLDDNLLSIEQSTSLIGIEILYKVVPFGENVNDIESMKFTYQGNNLRPFSPIGAKSIKAQNGDITISWTRRTRLNGQWRDYVDIPIDEESEKYNVVIYMNDSQIRVIEVTNTSTIYTRAQQLEDKVQNNTDALEFRIFQLSSLVGRSKPSISNFSARL